MPWWLAFFVFGISVTLWVGIGGLRLLLQASAVRRRRSSGAKRLTPADVAVVIPAHNEELSIGATLRSVLDLVPTSNVHVIADGCDDRTTRIADSYGVQVLELRPSRGKAGGIEAAVAEFAIPDRFELLLIVDADTRLDPNYLDRGLRLMEDPAMAALAGYAHSDWQPAAVTSLGRYLLAYRARLYTVMQAMKYGQTWRHTNVTPIVPGFASMYRAKLLPSMDLNPPGLIIEDFNMTFELHHKKLGKVAFDPSVFGVCQDPHGLSDYYRQICRWWLGFWQTIRHHGLWPSWFSVALAVFLLEVLVVSVVLLAIAAGLLLLAAAPLTGGLALEWDGYADVHAWLTPLMTPLNLLIFVWVPDYLLSCIVAIWLRRPSLLVYGVGFLVLRVIDATATARTLAQLWRTKSTGRWRSPTRRAVSVRAPSDGTTPRSPAAVWPASGRTTPRQSRRELPASPLNRRDAEPVVRDALAVVNALVLIASLMVIAG